MEENRQRLAGVTSNLYKLSMERGSNRFIDIGKSVDLLTKRQKDAFALQNGIDVSKDGSQEDGHGSTAVLLESNVAVKSSVRPIKLPEVKRLPPYTTWIFLDRFNLHIIYTFHDLNYIFVSHINLTCAQPLFACLRWSSMFYIVEHNS